jgi:hypothetical protein
MRNIGSRSQGPSGAAAWPGKLICGTATPAWIVDTVGSLKRGEVDADDDPSVLWVPSGPALGSPAQGRPRAGLDERAVVVVMTSRTSLRGGLERDVSRLADVEAVVLAGSRVV